MATKKANTLDGAIKLAEKAEAKSEAKTKQKKAKAKDTEGKKAKKSHKAEIPFQVESVTCSHGMTLSLGNYEFLRADTSVTIRANKKCHTQEEADALRDEMYIAGWEVVKTELKAQIKAVKDKQAGKVET